MSKPLIVVESPTKVNTIKKALGKNFNVAATVGHIKDLPKNEMGIDIENNFAPKYTNIKGKQKIITALKKAAGDAQDIYLAPDPDREGEAIAWHTAEVLKKAGRRFHRILFHELTKNAIEQAMKHPDQLDKNRYEAQQARRILDRLVGYEISPLLWRKVRTGLSAGRVQSVAVRILCEREREIHAFVPEEYWSITAHLEGEVPPAFQAKLVKEKGKKIHIPDETAANNILEAVSGKTAGLDQVKKRTVRKNPSPPFTTSTLQQDAIRKLRFSAKRTMAVAQQLYEGVELVPGEPVGLITYMRTDSTRIAAEAAAQAAEYVRKTHGPDYALKEPRFFKNKKQAQDAHEAIRPTSVFHTPEALAPHLTKEQHALYSLIWRRFVACQMARAVIDRKTFIIHIDTYEFTATGSTVTFPGFMAVYAVSQEEDDKIDLPELSEGAVLTVLKFDPKQHFTQPPPRFTEASLVKEMEERGIGRPSTYAAIMSTIRDKGYVDLVKGAFHPTELGFIVNDLIVESFPDIFDVDFTARMEDDLDRVESDEVEAAKVLSDFYERFSKELASAGEEMLSMKGVGMPTDLTCPACGRKLRIKVGRNGHFLACDGYPECTFTSDYDRDEKGRIQLIRPVPDEETDKTCPACEKPLVRKQGRYGPFLACTGYPDCKHTESVDGKGDERNTGVACPADGCTGSLVKRQSKRGKVFYGCSRYPDCKFAVWDKPVAEKCPDCGSPILLEKTTKRDGPHRACPNKECGYKRFPESGDS